MTTISVSSTPLFQTAHRVLTGFTIGWALDTADIELLKTSAAPEEKKLRIDFLALRIIQREWA